MASRPSPHAVVISRQGVCKSWAKPPRPFRANQRHEVTTILACIPVPDDEAEIRAISSIDEAPGGFRGASPQFSRARVYLDLCRARGPSPSAARSPRGGTADPSLSGPARRAHRGRDCAVPWHERIGGPLSSAHVANARPGLEPAKHRASVGLEHHSCRPALPRVVRRLAHHNPCLTSGSLRGEFRGRPDSHRAAEAADTGEAGV